MFDPSTVTAIGIPVVVAVLSGAGAFIGASISSKATLRSAGTALSGIERQLEVQAAIKLADFRQEWINSLRDTMAEFQSFGITPGINQRDEREFYRLGTKIELLMNQSDKHYHKLENLLYKFLHANTTAEKYACNQEYIDLCQTVLKTEWEVLKRDLRTTTKSKAA